MSRIFTAVALAVVAAMVIVTALILFPRVFVVLVLVAAVVGLVDFAWRRADAAKRESERIRRKHFDRGDAA